MCYLYQDIYIYVRQWVLLKNGIICKWVEFFQQLKKLKNKMFELQYNTIQYITTHNAVNKMTSKTIAHDQHLLNLIESIMHYSKDKMIESVESFNKVIDIIIFYKDDITTNDLQELIFHVSCKSYPKVAIFMMENNMCSKETHFTKYNDFIPLQTAIKCEQVELVKYFVENLEYFGELLIVGDSKSRPPLWLIADNPNGILMLKLILKSEHCTVQTLKHKYEYPYGSNALSWYADITGDVNNKLFKTMFESEKCTLDVILDCPSVVFRNAITFKMVLDSGKLPLDYFENYLEIFNYPNQPFYVFLNSEYCNEQLVEKYLFTLKDIRVLYPNKPINISRILIHPTHAHFAEKYNSNGTIKPGYEESKINNALEQRVISLKNDVECVKLDNQILSVQVEKLELEKQLLMAQLNKR